MPSINPGALNILTMRGAVALPKGTDPELLRFSLPQGFPIPTDDETGQIIEPVLFYLVDRHLGTNGQFVLNSAISAAADLRDWWGYLIAFGRRWDAVLRHDVETYRDVMLETVSPKTHEKYSEATVRRRVGTVLDYYRWAHAEGLFDMEAVGLNGKRIRRVRRPIDADPLAHVRLKRGIEVSDILPKSRRDPADDVHPFTRATWRQLARELGPLPLDEAEDARPSRDRLAAELALHTGMRVHEIVATTKHHIEALTFHPDVSPRSIVALAITTTKGSRPRVVYLPVWLIKELLAYINGERKQAVATGRTSGSLKRDPGSLFVNSANARANAGCAVKKYTLQAQFSAAVVRAGLTELVMKTDPDTTQHYYVREPKHSYHDLRHTFAIWTYYKRRQDGDAEPWIMVSQLLGHKDLATTLRIYLRPSARHRPLRRADCTALPSRLRKARVQQARLVARPVPIQTAAGTGRPAHPALIARDDRALGPRRRSYFLAGDVLDSEVPVVEVDTPCFG